MERSIIKVTFITTLNTNIGDDFIRIGIENILRDIYKDRKLLFTYINKHKPQTAINKKSWLYKLYNYKNFKGKNKLILFLNKLFASKYSILYDSNLIIQSGAPVLWPNCQNAEWTEPIWYNIIGKLYKKISVFNIAAGSCYPWEENLRFYSEDEKLFAKKIGNFCKLTTTRDLLAYNLFKSVGINNKLLPCTAFYVYNKFNNTNKPKYILINYMEGAGHFDWGQKIDKKVYENEMVKVVKELSKKYKVCFLCHDDKEYNLVLRIFGSFQVFFPKSVSEYLNIIQYAIIGINNRMHASVAEASMGIPSISICTDTRLLMLENLKQKIFYVKDINSNIIIENTEKLISRRDDLSQLIFKHKKETYNDYINTLKSILNVES